MIIDQSSSQPIDLKNRLCQIILEDKISSIERLSRLVGVDMEETRSVLGELVRDGSLNGSITEDGLRFFLSDVKVSDAPVAAPADLGPKFENTDTRIPKLIFISGIIIIVIGYILRSFVALGELIENVGGAVILVGLAVLIAGWLMFSKANPPSDKRL
ncbi:MAG: hypothetical protein ACFFCP_03245 [Promethearchaeota archaeon]